MSLHQSKLSEPTYTTLAAEFCRKCVTGHFLELYGHVQSLKEPASLIEPVAAISRFCCFPVTYFCIHRNSTDDSCNLHFFRQRMSPDDFTCHQK